MVALWDPCCHAALEPMGSHHDRHRLKGCREASGTGWSGDRTRARAVFIPALPARPRRRCGRPNSRQFEDTNPTHRLAWRVEFAAWVDRRRKPRVVALSVKQALSSRVRNGRLSTAIECSDDWRVPKGRKFWLCYLGRTDAYTSAWSGSDVQHTSSRCGPGRASPFSIARQ